MDNRVGAPSSVAGDEELMTIEEVAHLVRTPVATLRYWRYLGTGPHGFKVGRNLRYWRADVLTWLREQSSGSGPSAA